MVKIFPRKLMVASIAVVAISVAALSGCSGAGQTSSQSGKLTVTYMKSGTYDTAAKSLVPAFKKKTGTDVTVNAFPYATLQQNNTNAVIAGSCQYNVVSGSYYLAGIYNHFKSLDSLANKSGFADKLIPGLWAHSEFNNGQHIGVPYGPDAYGLVYRTDLFTDAGLSWPTTWPDLITDLKVLKDKYSSQGISPITFAGGAPEQLPALFFATYDGYFIDKAGHYALDPAKAAKAMDFAQQILALAGPNTNSTSIDAANANFVNGKAAVMYGWPSFVQTMASDPKQSKVVGKWALGNDPQGGMVWLSLWQSYMTDCTSNSDAAWNWMTTFSSPATDKKLFVDNGVNPEFKSTYSDPTLAQQYSHYFPGLQANLARAVNPPLSGESQDFLASTLGALFTTNGTPADAVSKINAKWASMAVPKPLLAEGKQNGFVEK